MIKNRNYLAMGTTVDGGVIISFTEDGVTGSVLKENVVCVNNGEVSFSRAGTFDDGTSKCRIYATTQVKKYVHDYKIRNVVVHGVLTSGVDFLVYTDGAHNYITLFDEQGVPTSDIPTRVVRKMVGIERSADGRLTFNAFDGERFKSTFYIESSGSTLDRYVEDKFPYSIANLNVSDGVLYKDNDCEPTVPDMDGVDEDVLNAYLKGAESKVGELRKKISTSIDPIAMFDNVNNGITTLEEESKRISDMKKSLNDIVANIESIKETHRINGNSSTNRIFPATNITVGGPCEPIIRSNKNRFRKYQEDTVTDTKSRSRVRDGVKTTTPKKKTHKIKKESNYVGFVILEENDPCSNDFDTSSLRLDESILEDSFGGTMISINENGELHFVRNLLED